MDFYSENNNNNINSEYKYKLNNMINNMKIIWLNYDAGLMDGV